MPMSCGSRPISARDCRASTWSACPTPACGKPRTGARRHHQQRLRVSCRPHHRQPVAGRPAQGIGPLRPADRAGAAAGIGAVAGASIRRRRGRQAIRHAGVRVHAGAPGPGGRAVADRRADACHGAAADRAGRGARSARRDARPARRQRGAGGLGARPARAVGPQPGGRGGAHHGRACPARRGSGALARAAARACLSDVRGQPAAPRTGSGGRRRPQLADGGPRARACWRSGCRACCRRCRAGRRWRPRPWRRWPAMRRRPLGSRHSGRRIIPCPCRRWWAAAPIPGLERSAWRITACCFWMNCPNSTGARWNRCASRWKPAGC